MRASIALVLCGELLALVGIGLWSVPAALLIAGIQLAAVGLLRQAKDDTADRRKPPSKAQRVAQHRRPRPFARFRKRADLRVVRGVAS